MVDDFGVWGVWFEGEVFVELSVLVLVGHLEIIPTSHYLFLL